MRAGLRMFVRVYVRVVCVVCACVYVCTRLLQDHNRCEDDNADNDKATRLRISHVTRQEYLILTIGIGRQERDTSDARERHERKKREGSKI
jgi:hypothetical protein